MRRGNRLQLSRLDHDIDWRAAGKSIRSGKCHVVVEMMPVVQRKGLLWQPDVLTAEIRADVGIVLSVPDKPVRFRGQDIAYPAPGTMVGVNPPDGTWLEGADLGDYETENQIRVYGIWNAFYGEPHKGNWWESIPCEIHMNEQTQSYELGARVTKLVVELDPIDVKTESGFYLGDPFQYRSGMGTIRSVGEAVDLDAKPGDRVCLDVAAIKSIGLRVDLADFHEDICICDELAVLYVIPQATEAREAVPA